MTQIKVVAFDVFGTLLEMSGVPREEIKAYIAHCVKRPWSPLELPEEWKDLRAFRDVHAGLNRLGSKYKCVTCSNGSAEVLFEALIEHSIEVMPLEYYAHTYKPDPAAYMTVCKRFGVEPAEVLFVTANPTFGPFPFGDIEMARMLGMSAQLIRNPGTPQTIVELAEQLGA